MYSVAIIEANRFVRRGLELILYETSEFISVGSYLCWDDAFHSADFFTCHLVLCGLKLPGMPVIEGIRTLSAQNPSADVIIFTDSENSSAILQALYAGAVGFVDQHSDSRDLLNTMRLVARGGAPITPAIAQHILLENLKSRNVFTNRLTKTEILLLKGIAQGLSVRSVAKRLSFRPGQVFQTIRHIYQKLHKNHH